MMFEPYAVTECLEELILDDNFDFKHKAESVDALDIFNRSFFLSSSYKGRTVKEYGWGVYLEADSQNEILIVKWVDEELSSCTEEIEKLTHKKDSVLESEMFSQLLTDEEIEEVHEQCFELMRIQWLAWLYLYQKTLPALKRALSRDEEKSKEEVIEEWKSYVDSWIMYNI